MATTTLRGEHRDQSEVDGEKQGDHEGVVEANSKGDCGVEGEKEPEVEPQEELTMADSMEGGVEGEAGRREVGVAGEESYKSKTVEFVTLQVKGQSFMIHQIRKMIGLVIAIVRGFTPESTLVEAFGKRKVSE